MMDCEMTIEVKTFGDFSLTWNGQTICEPLRALENQSWQLLKYMILSEGRSVSMSELMRELSFTDRTRKVENTIRVRVRRGRELLEPLELDDCKTGLLLYADEQFWINHNYALKIDINEAEESCRVALLEQTVPETALAACGKALQLYQGEFLKNTKPTHWILHIREYHNALFRQVLDRCLDLMVITNDFSLADAACASALQMAPFDLNVHSHILRSLLNAGLIFEPATFYSKLALVFANTDVVLPPLITFYEQ